MKTAVIYGATKTGRSLYELTKDKYEVLYFVDGDLSLIGDRIDEKEIRKRDVIFEDIPDVVLMGILTGYEDAVEYLRSNGMEEERIICSYVDLPSRARRDYLEKVSQIFREKGNVPGAVAELGVYRGDFARIINKVFPDRKLYLFDTFEGFPEADIQYEEENGLLLSKVGKLANTSVEYVLGRMPYPDNCIIKRGYFPETTVGLEKETFAFVNIDVDLYKPILAGLEYFWPRMADGGYILVHDYFSFSYAGAKKAIQEFVKKHQVGFVPIGDTLSVAFIKKGKN